MTKENTMENFVTIRTKTLKPEIRLGFNVYIKVGKRNLLYTRAEDDFDEERLKSLNEKKVKKLYIPSNDEENYQDYLQRCLDWALSRTDDSGAEVITGACASSIENFYDDPTSQASYKAAEGAAKGIIKALSKKEGILKEIFDGGGEEEVHIKYAINVSTLCVKLGETISLSQSEIEVLSLAGLLHDIGRIKMPIETHHLFETDYEKFTNEDWKSYKDHPRLGAEMMQDKEYASRDLIQLILLHEEKLSGEGFPNKTRDLDSKAQVLSLVCAFYREVFFLKKEPGEVIKDFMMNQIGNYELELMKTFKKVLKQVQLT